MPTKHSRLIARFMLTPSVALLLLWMVIPLGMTIYFSLIRYNLLRPERIKFSGLDNYTYLLTDPAFTTSVMNTLILVLGVILITVVMGTLLAIVLNKEFFGRGVARLFVIAPFFVMPTVSALVWKNMFFNPENGLFAYIAKFFDSAPIDFLGDHPLASVIGIVAWQWIPFASLILLTALQSLDKEQLEAAEMDGASKLSRFWYLVIPHLARPLAVVILIESIFLLAIFAEIYVTTQGGPGTASSNLAWMIYKVGSLAQDVGGASAGGIIAIVLANIVAIFLMRMVGKNLDN